MGLRQLGQAARVVQRVVHGVEQRQIAHLFLIDVGTLILATPGLHAQVASYKIMSCFERRKDLAQSKVPLSILVSLN